MKTTSERIAKQCRFAMYELARLALRSPRVYKELIIVDNCGRAFATDGVLTGRTWGVELTPGAYRSNIAVDSRFVYLFKHSDQYRSMIDNLGVETGSPECIPIATLEFDTTDHEGELAKFVAETDLSDITGMVYANLPNLVYDVYKYCGFVVFVCEERRLSFWAAESCFKAPEVIKPNPFVQYAK